MPTFYNFTQNGVVYSFDDVFVPSDLFRNGNLFTWGSNNFAQLGTNDTTNRSTPVTTSAGGANWKQVSSKLRTTVAIKTDGTLWTWGYGDNAQLGNANTTNRSTPVTTFAGGTNWKQVDGGNPHTVAIKTDGTLWTWGFGFNGRLGNNDSNLTRISTPITTFAGGTNWKQVSASFNHTAAIKTDGTLWVWGLNNNLQLGINDTINRNTPVTTFAGGTNWKQVSAGDFNTAAIKTDGTLWIWGVGNSGRLGNTVTTNTSTPVTTFAGGNNWKQVSAGDGSMAAVKTDGTLWTWGSNSVGQLGINNAIDRSTPVTTFAGGTNWKQVSAGGSVKAAVKTDGTLWTWGLGSNGVLGNGITTGNISTPITTFAGGTNWKQVSAESSGSDTVAAVTYDDPGI